MLRRMRVAPLVAAAISLAAVTFSTAAHSNGRAAGANQLVVGPNSELTLRMTFGLLLADDAGKWRWVCESAVGYGGIQDPAIGIMSDKTIIAGLFTGLSHSAVDRCSWTFVPGDLDNQVVSDVTVRKDDPKSAFAVTCTYDGGGGANPQYKVQLHSTSDNGASWKTIGTPLPRNAFVETLEVAPSRPSRLYVSAALVEAPLHGVVYTTDDTGATWSATDVNLLASDGGNVEKALYIAAVDPADPDRVYARTGGDGPTRLLVSENGGKTWAERIKLKGQMLGFALAPDGKRVYVGGPQDGILVASTTDWQFTQTATIQVDCLTAHAMGLYACSNEANGFVLGLSGDEGKTFKTLLHFADIQGPLACATEAGAQCSSEWPALRDRLGASLDPDAGSLSDAGSGSDASGPGGPKPGGSGCACNMTHGGQRGASLIALTTAALVVFLRRKTRRSAR